MITKLKFVLRWLWLSIQWVNSLSNFCIITILFRWKNYFHQLLNVQGPGGIRQTEIRTAEQFVPQPSAAEVEVAIRKMKSYKAPGSDQIPA
jgi:hypothetical protein